MDYSIRLPEYSHQNMNCNCKESHHNYCRHQLHICRIELWFHHDHYHNRLYDSQGCIHLYNEQHYLLKYRYCILYLNNFRNDCNLRHILHGNQCSCIPLLLYISYNCQSIWGIYFRLSMNHHCMMYRYLHFLYMLHRKNCMAGIDYRWGIIHLCILLILRYLSHDTFYKDHDMFHICVHLQYLVEYNTHLCM